MSVPNLGERYGQPAITVTISGLIAASGALAALLGNLRAGLWLVIAAAIVAVCMTALDRETALAPRDSDEPDYLPSTWFEQPAIRSRTVPTPGVWLDLGLALIAAALVLFGVVALATGETALGLVDLALGAGAFFCLHERVTA